MLTIKQLADSVGVTVRAVRHYHQRGLLPEPERDASGYRRYGAQAVVDLIRIKTLADAGVPLARIEELSGASPAEFADAVTQIDAALRAKVRELNRHRRLIAELADGGGERLFLPPEIVGILERLREIGVSERTVTMERDGWVLMAALSPESVGEWAREKSAMLADPDFQQLYLVSDEAFDWDPADPRLAGLATQMAAWEARRGRPGSPAAAHAPGNPLAVSLLASYVASVSPAWQHLAGDRPPAGAVAPEQA